MDDFLLADQEPQGAEGLKDGRAGLLPAHTGEIPGFLVQGAVGAQDVHDGKAVALAAVVVGGVVPRSHLDHSRAEIGVHRRVGDDGDFPPDQGQKNGLSHQFAVTGVLRMDRDAGVAEHGFGPGGGHIQVS